MQVSTDTKPIELGPTSQLPVTIPEAQGPRNLQVEYIPKWLLLLTGVLGFVVACEAAVVVTYLLVEM